MEAAMADPVWRPTARLLAVDSQDRVLLFSALDTAGRPWWFTPGGGIHRGETVAAAAARELGEETGFVRSVSDVGPVVATSGGRWQGDDGRQYLAADSFFFVRVDTTSISTDSMEPLERSVITGHRWWTLAELRETTNVVFPLGLADLLTMLLCDGAPDHPVRLPWR